MTAATASAKLHADRRHGAWFVEVGAGNGEAVDGPSAREAGSAALDAWRAGLDDPWSPWALEYAKVALGDGEIACGIGERCAQAIAAGEPGFHATALRSWLDARATYGRLRAHRLPCAAGASSQRRRDGVAHWLAAILAWWALALLLVRCLGESAELRGGRVVALHGELGTRTRHLLDRLRDAMPDALLLVGMPRRRLSTVRAEWERQVGATLPPIVRPVSLAALLAATGEVLATVRDGARVAASCPWLPPFRERVAVAARVLHGLACARWWRAHGVAARVVYGHTGTADTLLLERAQQAAGSRTVHAVHGVSAGTNFVGISSVAVFRCAHDARWHERLGGYGRCVSPAAARPDLVVGGEGMLLLTSFAHPQYPGWRLGGLREETDVLRAAAAAFAAAGGTGPRWWKPHPALALLPASQQRELEGLAAELGFARVAASTSWQALAPTVRWAVSTESTVVIELLESGILPAMVPSPWSVPERALGGFPVLARDADSLTACLAGLDDLAWRRARFEEAWATIGPAARDAAYREAMHDA